jgi:hypothetical protein
VKRREFITLLGGGSVAAHGVSSASVLMTAADH